MSKSETWSTNSENTVGLSKRILAKLSLDVRADQLRIFLRELEIGPETTVLDVGMSPNETLVDSNFFEKNYPYPKSLTAASVEDCSGLQPKYPEIKIIKVAPNSSLPFGDGAFDVVTAWATLEHVGDFEAQDFFLSECLRVGKRVFLTVPYRGCIYEPHTGFFFLHWLPLRIFRQICEKTGRGFWASTAMLNPLYISDIKGFRSAKQIVVKLYSMFGVLPSHLIITKKD